MPSLDPGSKYNFTLVTGRNVEVIVHGSSSHPTKGTVLDVSVDGVRGTFAGLDEAIGGEYVSFKLIP